MSFWLQLVLEVQCVILCLVPLHNLSITFKRCLGRDINPETTFVFSLLKKPCGLVMPWREQHQLLHNLLFCSTSPYVVSVTPNRCSSQVRRACVKVLRQVISGSSLFCKPAVQTPSSSSCPLPSTWLPSSSVGRACDAVRDIKLSLIIMQTMRTAGQWISIPKAITMLPKT